MTAAFLCGSHEMQGVGARLQDVVGVLDTAIMQAVT